MKPYCLHILFVLDLLQAASAAALAAITRNHKENQDIVIAIDAAKPLVGLLKLRNMEVQVKAAAALESLAESNPHSQEAILALDAPTHLIRLLKVGFKMQVFASEIDEWNRMIKNHSQIPR